MRLVWSLSSSRQRTLGVFFAALLLSMTVGVFVYWPGIANGLQVQNRELQLSDSRIDTTTQYKLSFTTQSAATIGSIRLQLCSNSPLLDDACLAPAGLNVTAATLTAQTGLTGFSISPLSTGNVIILTRTGSPAGVANASYTFDGVHNPSTNGTYFGRIETFSSTNATGSRIDYGGLAFHINGGVSINLTVPPYLLFCVGKTIQPYDCATAQGDAIDFGEFTPNTTSTGQTQFLVGTNAEYGYAVRVTGTTLMSGINTIPELSTPDISRKGKSQFGLNLRANSSPPGGTNVQGPGTAQAIGKYNVPDSYGFVSGDVLATSATSDAYRLFTVEYIVNVDRNQAPGYYVSTLVYIALASF
ncbi:MAG TPA: hypothetical protein PLT04_01205 [Candidatus Saccharibacteria bacterium]|nr:hypothetical protein [Candidatus Saccharibacteria bacterium]